MEFKEVLEHESELTQKIRDQVSNFEGRANNFLNELVVPWEGDMEEEEEEEEEEDA